MVTRLSNFFLRTLREDPADAEVTSHRLLVRAGYIRRQAPGIFAWLPLGLKVKAKIEAVIRDEMANAGAYEVHFPALLPREPYEVTGRWEEYGDGMFRLQDRKGADYLLAPTHEEVFTLLVKDLYSSYKDLPLAIYQIQDKYRDEARPRAGLLRGREFTMKDAYSFDYTDEGLDASYQAQRDAYERIFQRLGLEYVIVAADAGPWAARESEEFLHPTAVGEDTFVRSAGGYAANVEAFTTVVSRPDPVRRASRARHLRLARHADDRDARRALQRPPGPRRRGRVDRRPHAEERRAGAHPPRRHPRTRDRRHPGRPRCRRQARRGRFRPRHGRGRSTKQDFENNPLLVKGYIGPWSADRPGARRRVGHRHPLSRRSARRDGTSWITGANIDEKHVHSLVAGRDFAVDGYRRGRQRPRGRPRARRLRPGPLARGMEIGHVFQLGRKYADALGLKVLDENGKLVTVTMGSYGIGVTRILAILAELNSDEKGLVWPATVAPFDVHVVATGRDAVVFDVSERLSAELEAAGLDVLYDDRPKVSPGVKFGDAELIGVPKIVIVGRGAADGQVELWDRRTGAREVLAVEDAVATLSR